MQILYDSTRGGEKNVTASQAILKGLADDGGLFVPQSVPALDIDIETLAGYSYKETAFEVMRRFLTDFTEEELKYCIENAYDEKFEVPEAARLRDCGKESFLELYHGKTIAFKDMALSILPYLMTTSAVKNGMDKEIVILTATSGDTGKAAMAGFADVPGTRIIVFYPKDGVSPVQERQMVTQKGENTCVIAVKGNFDDAQTGVKKIFNDKDTAKQIGEAGFAFSSANSINIGRLVPQVVYYVWSYAQMFKNGRIKAGEKINFVVPTGNFGNILAAYYAFKMGIPVNRLICASNVNNVLFDFFSTGVYNKNREFILTSSPSMDILVSSNLERLIYESAGNDPEKCAELMSKLRNDGVYETTSDMMKNMDIFTGEWASEEECAEAILGYYKEYDYVIDTHTAVAAAAYKKYTERTGDGSMTVIASTASPYKFARSVLHAIDEKYDAYDDMEQFDILSQVSGTKLPDAITELKNAEIRHRDVIEAGEMKDTILKKLGVI